MDFLSSEEARIQPLFLLAHAVWPGYFTLASCTLCSNTAEAVRDQSGSPDLGLPPAKSAHTKRGWMIAPHPKVTPKNNQLPGIADATISLLDFLILDMEKT